MLRYITFFVGFIATLLGVIGKTRKDDSQFPKKYNTHLVEYALANFFKKKRAA